jgi:hypothetical protein
MPRQKLIALWRVNTPLVDTMAGRGSGTDPANTPAATSRV